ncbi:hypothetical protein BE08_29940 [Sorangium cellulosum]|uniref:Uncharacterized protein n=1 Tax=Sorangium cellulosum TaxID=56 RepID=A0A150P0P3_SORCE|nr:hypothetical protein BE08_29940 [Sorangium cellulosum]
MVHRRWQSTGCAIQTLLREWPPARRDAWRAFTGRLVRGHLDRAERVRQRLAPEDRRLDRWPEPERAALGLLGEARLALLCQRTYEERLAPTLVRLGLG